MNDVAADTRIRGWHAHVYFDASTLAQARRLCEEAATLFELKMGRVHEQLVGPHPAWSCQLALRPAVFAQLIPWLVLQAQGLSIFVHPITGNDLADHRDHGMWIGPPMTINLSVFRDDDPAVIFEL
ncbi:MAG: DOPA 4,5-dioxygenase family protein [Pseudomonas sp.]